MMLLAWCAKLIAKGAMLGQAHVTLPAPCLWSMVTRCNPCWLLSAAACQRHTALSNHLLSENILQTTASQLRSSQQVGNLCFEQAALLTS